MFARLALVLLGLCAFTGMTDASAQYMQNPPSSPPSPAVLAQCQELGIMPEDCTEMELLKRNPICIGWSCRETAYEPPTIYPIIIGLGVAVLVFGFVTLKRIP